MSTTVVECSPPVSPTQEGAAVPVGAVASHEFTCAQSDVPIGAIVPFVPAEPWALPIIDLHGRFIGFVTEAALAGRGLPPRLFMAMPAIELVSGRALAVHEDCSLKCAIHAMASHGTRVIALLGAPGDLRGVLTDIEALHAVTRGTISSV
jgi:CBS-domain-containing membrane protein